MDEAPNNFNHPGEKYKPLFCSTFPMAAKILLLGMLILFSVSFFPLDISAALQFPAVFNFGDSNSDTGELATAFRYKLPYPYGENYQLPSARFCNGRLIIDFLVEAMGLPFLNPYLESFGGAASFQQGCNFAAGGSTIHPATATSISPFSFRIQVSQFLEFKARALQAQAKSNNVYNSSLPAKVSFGKGLYMFDIGQNDLVGAFYYKSLDQVVASIPAILTEFEAGIQMLYNAGARHFRVHNTGPAGCLPQNIAKFGTDPSKLDEAGCVKDHNTAAKAFNQKLLALCVKLRQMYWNAKFAYVDIFSIKSHLIANYSQYGFAQPLMACCGYGGPPLNFDSEVSCGQTKYLGGSFATAQGCSNPTQFVNWDGTHYTEAANRYAKSQILTGKFSR